MTRRDGNLAIPIVRRGSQSAPCGSLTNLRADVSIKRSTQATTCRHEASELLRGNDCCRISIIPRRSFLRFVIWGNRFKIFSSTRFILRTVTPIAVPSGGGGCVAHLCPTNTKRRSTKRPHQYQCLHHISRNPANATFRPLKFFSLPQDDCVRHRDAVWV